MGPGQMFGSGAGPLNHVVVVFTTMDIWTLINDYTLNLRSGPQDGLCMKVLDQD